MDDKVGDKKLQFDINREVAKILALSSDKIDKHEYLRGGEILPSDQSRTTEEARFTCSALERVFQKQIKTIKNQGRKQVEALEVSKPDVNQQDLNKLKEYFWKRWKLMKLKLN